MAFRFKASITSKGTFPTAVQVNNALQENFTKVVSEEAAKLASSLNSKFGHALAQEKNTKLFKVDTTANGVTVGPSSPENLQKLLRVEYGSGDNTPKGYLRLEAAQVQAKLKATLAKIKAQAKKDIFS